MLAFAREWWSEIDFATIHNRVSIWQANHPMNGWSSWFLWILPAFLGSVVFVRKPAGVESQDTSLPVFCSEQSAGGGQVDSPAGHLPHAHRPRAGLPCRQGPAGPLLAAWKGGDSPGATRRSFSALARSSSEKRSAKRKGRSTAFSSSSSFCFGVEGKVCS